MIILHDPLGQTQSQSPSTFFRGEAWLKNLLEVAFWNAFASVFHIYIIRLPFGTSIQGDAAFLALNGIQRIFEQILDYPVKQLWIDKELTVQWNLVVDM